MTPAEADPLGRPAMRSAQASASRSSGSSGWLRRTLESCDLWQRGHVPPQGHEGARCRRMGTGTDAAARAFDAVTDRRGVERERMCARAAASIAYLCLLYAALLQPEHRQEIADFIDDRIGLDHL
jgi:hypothetical protein